MQFVLVPTHGLAVHAVVHDAGMKIRCSGVTGVLLPEQLKP